MRIFHSSKNCCSSKVYLRSALSMKKLGDDSNNYRTTSKKISLAGLPTAVLNSSITKTFLGT